mmetsp:Transcript_43589/g.138795  ORF Transcript_43589/g.138795 Transcript_43589/m.138795 type:complete len:98 (+) Transcript_43589:117-410(+)
MGTRAAPNSTGLEAVEAAEPEPETLSQAFVECVLDLFTCVGRGCVATRRASCAAAGHAVYPVKEAMVNTLDGATACIHPYKTKRPVGNDVASFRYGA